MNIEAVKLELMQLLLNTNKESILLKIKRIYQEESSDWWDELSAEEQREIEKSILEDDKGEITAHQTVMKQFEKWK